ncbi:MAG: diguanylate cyclase [Candidatus Riflebacteria bacterium]|nr:diguanylate cyclase [Candidatus Riflebacteria bacterium]
MPQVVTRVKQYLPYIEGLVFVSIAVFINKFFFPDSPGFRGLPFSPLWIPILLIAGRYGTFPSLFTSFICAWYYFFSVSLENFIFGIFELTMEDKVVMFAFFFVSVFLGQMYDRLHDRIVILQSDVEDIGEQHRNLKQHFEKLERTNEELERRVVGKHTTLNSLYEMARQLDSLDENALYRGVIELTCKFLYASKAVLYIGNINEIKVGAAFGYLPEDYPFLIEKVKSNPLALAAWKSEEPLSFRNDFEEQATLEAKKRIYMAATINLISTGKVAGLLTVDELPFLAVNSPNLRILGIIADWTAQNIEKTRAFIDLQARELDDQLTGVFSYSFFQIRIAEELNRSQRHNVPMSLILMKIQNYSKMEQPVQLDLLSVIGLVFQNSIRQVDIPCRFSNSETLALILPLTESAGAKLLADKLKFNIESYSFKPFKSNEELTLKFSVAEFRPQTGKKRIYSLSKEMIDQFIQNAEEELG